ncbi:hypothetical protein PsorP6_017412 [Peronosclerospora sorghi]|uniref:Uncharacterized protein n=1 Tax=Peronosclerospora sorghi TaxID=230839 RepID=A0ACC0WLQ3_9STRA|nr:hypothetical protein PsorP6_017412 [Peronosclerospora sorghi]
MNEADHLASGVSLVERNRNNVEIIKTAIEDKPYTFVEIHSALTLSNTPIFWSEEELSWLKGSYITQQIQDRKAAIRKYYDLIMYSGSVVCEILAGPFQLGV